MGPVTKLKRIVVLFLASLLIWGLPACEPGDVDLLIEFAQDWMLANADKLAIRAMSGSSGDPWVDAAVDAGEVLMNFQAAEDLMDHGRKNRDPKAMDDALAKRPNDWSYNLSRANLALEQGDVDEHRRRRERADENAQSPRNQRALVDQEIAELEDVRARLTGYNSGLQCRTLNQALAQAYWDRYELRVGPDNARNSVPFGGDPDYDRYEDARRAVPLCPN